MCQWGEFDGGKFSKKQLSVAIIPYTYEYTNFQYLKVGSTVNLEFDIIGKYISKMNA